MESAHIQKQGSAYNEYMMNFYLPEYQSLQNNKATLKIRVALIRLEFNGCYSLAAGLVSKGGNGIDSTRRFLRHPCSAVASIQGTGALPRPRILNRLSAIP